MTFLDLAYQRLCATCAMVRLSGSKDRGTKYTPIADPPESYGPISGIHASLAFAILQGYDAVVFTPIDTPFLSVDDIQKLIDTFRSIPDQVVCAISDDHETSSAIEPLIAVYPIRFADTIQRAIEVGQYSLQRILAAETITTVPLSASACRNLNTPFDLKPLTDDE